MSSGSGEMKGWCVEARCDLQHPQQVNGVLLGSEWVRLSFPEAPIGVKRGSSWQMPFLRLTDLCCYEAAQALRWWWLSNAGSVGGLGVETRLVCHKVKYEFSSERIGTREVIGGDDTRWVHSPDHGLVEDEQPTDEPQP